MPSNTDPTKSWPGKAGIKTNGPSVFKTQDNSQPVIKILSDNGASSIEAYGYAGLYGSAYVGGSLSVQGPSYITGYYNGTTDVFFRVQTQKASGGNSIFTVIGNGTVNAVANSAASETLRLQTQGATTKSLVIEDLRDNSIVLSIDTDGNFSGTSTATSWRAFTSSIIGTGWAIGDGLIAARYTRFGSTVTFQVTIVFGSTSTYGSVAPRVVMVPSGVDAGANTGTSFNATYVDGSTGDMYPGRAVIMAGDPNQPELYTGTSPMTPVVDTAPFTWTTGDRIIITGTYEVD